MEKMNPILELFLADEILPIAAIAIFLSMAVYCIYRAVKIDRETTIEPIVSNGARK
jgi:hypothetical protein